MQVKLLCCPADYSTIADTFFQLKEIYSGKEVENALEHNKTVFGSLFGCPCDASLMWQYRNIWQREFVIDEDVIKSVGKRKENLIERYFQQNNDTSKQIPIMIGAHVRRTDYAKLLTKYKGGTLLPKEYYFKAFDYFRKK